MTSGDPVSFPDGFLLGTATAAYQVEGSVTAGGRGPSIWDTFSHTPGKVHNGDSGDVSCRHFLRTGEDLDLLADLGPDAYRFSVSWPRIQPTGRGPANQQGLDFYRRLTDGLRDRGIRPVLTLYHWDLPQALEDAGGWPQRDTAYRFAEYAELVIRALGDQVERWITLNEPWCSAWLGYGSGHHAPGGRDVGAAAAATHHLLLGHGLALQAIRAAAPAAAAGISLNLTPIRPATGHQADVAAAWRADGNSNRLFLDPVLRGRYPADALAHYETQAPGFTVIQDGDLAVISQPLDFLGINFYSPRTVADAARGAQARAAGHWLPAAAPDPVEADLQVMTVSRPGFRRTEMGWEVEPAALSELLIRIHREYPPVPLLVTENGAACSDYVDPEGQVHDPDRIAYLDAHLRAVAAAREVGVDVAGYFVWSMLDNFEWAYGYSKRFGLVWVDYPTGTRIPKDSFRWYRDTIRARALPSAAGAASQPAASQPAASQPAGAQPEASQPAHGQPEASQPLVEAAG